MLLSVTRAASAGPLPADVIIRNDGPSAMQCQVLAAHWYARPAVDVPAATVLRLRLMLDMRSGEVTDPVLQGLPVERLYCGPVGRAWDAGVDIDFRTLAARAVAGRAVPVACGDTARGFTCTDAPPAR